MRGIAVNIAAGARGLKVNTVKTAIGVDGGYDAGRGHSIAVQRRGETGSLDVSNRGNGGREKFARKREFEGLLCPFGEEVAFRRRSSHDDGSCFSYGVFACRNYLTVDRIDDTSYCRDRVGADSSFGIRIIGGRHYGSHFHWLSRWICRVWIGGDRIARRVHRSRICDDEICEVVIRVYAKFCAMVRRGVSSGSSARGTFILVGSAIAECINYALIGR